MNIPSNIVTLIAGIVVTLISLWYGQNHGLLPIAASKEASQVDELFNLMMTIATGLFLLVEGVIVYSIIKFRRKKGDTTDGPPIEGNVPLEIVWTAIPTVIVFILAIYSFEVYNAMGGLDPMASHDMGPQQQIAMNSEGTELALGIGESPENTQSKEPLIVDVKGIQYAWIFTYPDTGIIAGDLHVPVDRPVQLNITAGDVLHAFWLPEFRIKQDAIPGRDAKLTFTSTRVGQYPIICAELCGAYHGGMKTQLTVHTAEDYQQWVQDNTFAQADETSKSMALSTTKSSDTEFLAPYAEDLGIDESAIATLHPTHHH